MVPIVHFGALTTILYKDPISEETRGGIQHHTAHLLLIGASGC